MTYDNTNKGVLFINDRKQKDTHPDFKGSIDVSGVSYWLSGWRKTTSKGETISLTVESKGAKPITAHSEAKGNGYVAQPAIDDEIPF